MASDAATRARILAHMNKDHVYDTKLYLVHRLAHPKSLLSPSSPSVVSLSDITTTDLTVSVDGAIHRIPISPPMASLSDARVRLVEMTQRAEAALGVSRDTVDIEITWLPPLPWELGLTLAMILATYILFVPSSLLPGGVLREMTPLKDHPAVARWMYSAVPFGYWTLVTLHVGEAAYFAWGVLGRYWTVPGMSALTAGIWLGEVLVVGYLGFYRWGKMIKRQKAKRKGSKAEKKEH
ncbi:hypothetical protein DRE_00119 [Drechslerella stenobrocha 248]|uniref:DUF2470 domain-containing protein n=1 Tax=Drechslerella stenobrocha 248 TaxID=1043628 RepID=W7HZ71_9PEZI|nr:hypothetical protein DRE_00119 [Drechslerella stenobrocha 248]